MSCFAVAIPTVAIPAVAIPVVFLSSQGAHGAASLGLPGPVGVTGQRGDLGPAGPSRESEQLHLQNILLGINSINQKMSKLGAKTVALRSRCPNCNVIKCETRADDRGQLICSCDVLPCSITTLVYSY